MSVPMALTDQADELAVRNSATSEAPTTLHLNRNCNGLARANQLVLHLPDSVPFKQLQAM